MGPVQSPTPTPAKKPEGRDGALADAGALAGAGALVSASPGDDGDARANDDERFLSRWARRVTRRGMCVFHPACTLFASAISTRAMRWRSSVAERAALSRGATRAATLLLLSSFRCADFRGTEFREW